MSVIDILSHTWIERGEKAHRDALQNLIESLVKGKPRPFLFCLLNLEFFLLIILFFFKCIRKSFEFGASLCPIRHS